MDRKKDDTKPKDRPSQDLQSIGGYAPDGQTTLRIVVKTFEGETFQAFVRPSDAILVIKKQLEVHKCIPVTQQLLFFAKQRLEDRFSVESYNIQDGGTLCLKIRWHFFQDLKDVITVKTLSGLTVDIIESSNYNETIAECKSKLHNEQGIPLKDQGLFYAGNQLEDSKTLAHCNIQKGSTIHLVPLINTILVKTLTGKTITIHNFTWNDTIAEFKKKIETEQFLKTGEGIPPKDQHLVYAGIQLDYGGKTMSYRYAGIQLGDSKTLAHYKTHYNMKTGSTIRLVNREVGHVFSLICEINSMGQKAGSSKKAVREAAARVSAMIPILNEILDEDANELRPFVAVLLRNLLLFKVRSKPFVFLMRARTLREELMGLCQTMEVSMEAVRIRKKGNSPQPPPDSESSDGSVKSLAPISAATGENSEEVLLVVEIVAGRNLLIGGKHSSDPYVTVMMGEDQIHKTKHINKTKNPIYTPETESTFLLDCPATDLSQVGGLHFIVKDWDRITNDELGRAVVSHLNLTKGTGQGMEFMVEPPNGVAKEPGDAGYLLIRCRKASKADAEFLKHPHHAPKNMFPTTTKEAASSAWSFLEKQLEEAVEVVGAPPVPSPEEERAAAAEIKETKRRERTEAVLNKMDEMQRRAAMAEELADMQAQRIQKIGRMSAAKQESSPIATATAEAMRPSSIVTSTNNVDKRREEPKQESSPIATAAGKIETEGVPGGDGGSKNTTAAAASGLPKDGTQRLKKPPDWNFLGGDMETIRQWTAILEHLKHQINPERKISQFTPIPQRYTGNRVAMKYHRTFEDCLYTTVSVMRIQSQSLGLPQPSFVSGLIRVSSQTAGGVGGLLLPLIGEMMASIIGRRHAAACVDSAISFLEALPASDGVRLDQFITKLSSTMVHMQVERAKDRTIDRVLSGLEIGVIPQSASANGTGKSIGERMHILVQTWQESIKKKARAMKLEARMTTENDPDKAAAVVHAGLIARAMVENFESMQNLKVEQTPEQAALYLLQTMNFPFNSPQQKTTPGGTTGPAAAQAIAPPQASSPTTTRSSPTAATIHTDKKKDGQTEAPPQVDLAKFLSEFQDMKEKLERLEKEKEEGWKPTEQGQNRVRRTVDRTQVLNLGVGVAATSSSSDVACSYRPDTPPEVSDQRQQLFGGLPEEQQSNTEAVLSSLNGEIQQVKERLEYVEEQSSETEALVRDHLLAADLKEMKRRVKLAKKIVRNNAVSNPQEEPSDLGFQTTRPEEGCFTNLSATEVDPTPCDPPEGIRSNIGQTGGWDGVRLEGAEPPDRTLPEGGNNPLDGEAIWC